MMQTIRQTFIVCVNGIFLGMVELCIGRQMASKHTLSVNIWSKEFVTLSDVQDFFLCGEQ